MEQQTQIKQLKSCGLSEKEAILYAYLLEHGGGYPSTIAEKTKLNRSTTYKVLLDMAVKNLVSEIKKGKKLYYQIEKPNHLIQFAKQNVRKTQANLEHAQKLLPDLEGLYSLTPNKPQVAFYEGIDGVMKVYEDHILVDKKYEMLGIANVDKLTPVMPKKFYQHYRKVKQQLGITTRGIVPDSNKARAFNKKIYSDVDKKLWPRLKYVSPEKFPFEAEITIYGTSKVSLIKFQQDNPIGVIIDDQVLHDMMVMIFELAWEGAQD